MVEVPAAVHWHPPMHIASDMGLQPASSLQGICLLLSLSPSLFARQFGTVYPSLCILNYVVTWVVARCQKLFTIVICISPLGLKIIVPQLRNRHSTDAMLMFPFGTWRRVSPAAATIQGAKRAANLPSGTRPVNSTVNKFFVSSGANL